MPTTTTTQGCLGNGSRGGSGSALLPATPFYSPRYHFGMLLGVDDFECEQAYHRGKTRLHNAWLHGEGTVWGLHVDAPSVEGGDGSLTGELRVHPGLALDAAGRDLHLAAVACVSVPAWYRVHQDDPDLKEIVQITEDGTITFDAHVVARFRACLSRQVPAISEPCVGSGGDTAYSRTLETVELLLVPGPAPARSYPYHRLRLLFGLDAPALAEDDSVLPEDQEVITARETILGLASAEQPAAYLAAFRRFAAMDELDRRPAVTNEGEVLLFPADDDTVVVLADVGGITLVPSGDDEFDLIDLEVDETVRPTLVDTATIQELLCGPMFALVGAATEGTEAPEAPAGPPDAGGPRLRPDSITLEGEALSFRSDSPLSKASVAREAFTISAYDLRDGWREVEIARDPIVDKSGKKVRIELSSSFGGNLVRLIARGTGPAPLVGTNLVPLAGLVGGPPGGATDGNDCVLMVKRSEM